MKLFLFFILIINTAMPSVIAQQKNAQTNSNSKVEQELIELTRTLNEAFAKRDVKTLNSILSEDYVIYFGKQGLSKAWLLKWVLSTDFYLYTQQVNLVRLYGDTAVLYSTASIKIKHKQPDSHVVTDEVNSMDVWVKKNGRWRCVATMTEDIKPETTPAKYSLVVYFNEGVSENQINDFVQEKFFLPKDDKGFSFQKGIYAYTRVTPVQNHQAVAINISDESERENIKARIKASPFVYKVLENVNPNEVKTVEK